ncbi:MAG TPA: hypothetical protein VL688_12510 [Verrucomicrobiae bacterium]|nr:hypothetical protein [Verrucomicrobiae bacterium]
MKIRPIPGLFLGLDQCSPPPPKKIESSIEADTDREVEIEARIETDWEVDCDVDEAVEADFDWDTDVELD